MLAFRLGYSPYPTCGQDLRAVDRMMMEWLPSFFLGTQHTARLSPQHSTAVLLCRHRQKYQGQGTSVEQNQ